MKTMKVAELKAIIRKHNLMYAIRGYSRMHKGHLVDALVKQDRNSFCALSIMVNAHNKSRDELKVMKVAELKALVRKHNLDNAIRQYSKMKKSELVEALMKHSTASGSFSPPLTVTKADGTVKELKKRVKKATVKPAAKKPAPKPAAKKPTVKPAAKKPAPKPAAKKPAPKPVDDDDDEDDFFANIGKGKGAIKKTTMSASYLASKKALRELRLKDPAAYQAKISAEAAAQKAKGNSLEEFDMKKKAAREAEAAAKKAAKKKPAAKKKAAAPKKKAAAKPKFTAKELKVLAEARRVGYVKVVDAIETGIFTEDSQEQITRANAALSQLYAKARRRAEAPANAAAIDKASLKELLGDMLKLKETLLAQKPRITALRKKANEANLKEDPTGKVKPGRKKGESYAKVVNNEKFAGGFSASYHPDESRMQDFIDKEADKLDKFIRMGSSISAAKTSGARQPTLNELGLEIKDQFNTKVPEVGWMGMTKLVVADFIKARSKAINAAVKRGK